METTAEGRAGRHLERPAPQRCCSRGVLALLGTLFFSSCVTGRLQQVSPVPESVTGPGFHSEMAAVAKSPWTSGNRVQTLENGGNFYPAMLGAIRAARETITFETYVAVDSPQVEEFTVALIERAKAGVKVHVILDAYGCNTWGGLHIKALRAGGVELKFYSSFNLLRPLRFNHRTHRRLLVVDGRTGFIGGAGLAYAWDGHAEDPSRWRDTMYQVWGPVVRQLQDQFNDNWQELTGRTLAGAGYYPALNAEGSLAVQAVLGSPEKREDTIGSSYLLAIRAARKSMLISHAYFIPTRPIADAIVEARARGVQVQILIPGKHTDMPLSLPVSLPSLRRFMKAGVEIYEYERCMMHGKLVVIDGHLSLIGSGNLDSRSFFINDENNLHVLGPTFAEAQRQMFERDKSFSRRLSEADLKLPLGRTIKGVLGRMVQHQL